MSYDQNHHTPLQHSATRCNTLQHAATRCNALHHTASQCNKLQHSAAYCNTLHHPATPCNTLHHTSAHYTTPKHPATHNTLQHTTTHLLFRFCLGFVVIFFELGLQIEVIRFRQKDILGHSSPFFQIPPSLVRKHRVFAFLACM